MQRRGIGVSNLPNLKHNHFIQKGCTFNIMAVGSHGLGKTTFLNHFLGSSILKSQPFDSRDENPFWQIESVCNIQTSYVEVYESGFMTRMNITEIDCVGDSTDNNGCCEQIVKLMERNLEDYYKKISKATKSLVDDKRVHLCLYFLEPIRFIKVADIEALKKISKYCTIIPIVAKADLLSPEYETDVKLKFREIFESNNIPFYDDKVCISMAPFFVFFQNRQDTPSTNSNYKIPDQKADLNEFSILKRLILEKSITHFVKETDQFYDNYRVFSMIFQGNEEGVGKSLIEKKIENFERQLAERKQQIRMQRMGNTSMGQAEAAYE